MSRMYLESQRQRAINLRESLFNDPGLGYFMGKPREFVLKNPALNLFSPIRKEALFYFQMNQIHWWMGKNALPTGHLLSSQIACVNHLFSLRNRQDIATKVLRSIEPGIESALPIDGGFVAFEFIGNDQYLKESTFVRGKNCTSIDAAMLGETVDHKRTLFLIEWKYTESYGGKCKYKDRRALVYDHLIKSPDGPFVSNIEPEKLYFEPFYQMMRQTLLAHQFEIHRELDCDRCIHIHVIPEANKQLKDTISCESFKRFGDTIHDVWASVLKKPYKYCSVDPIRFLAPARTLPNTTDWFEYLRNRYW